jgi:hypothetical protein
MPDVFTLAAIPSLARLRSPEMAVAVANDASDAVASANARLSTIEARIGLNLGVIDAVDARLKLRRPIPLPAPLESVQSLIQRGRRRLERERQGAARQLETVRLAAVTKLRSVLEP